MKVHFLQVLESSGCVLALALLSGRVTASLRRQPIERGWKIIRQSAGKKCCSAAAADYYSDFRDIEIKVRPIGEPIHSVPRAMLTEFHSPITNPFDSRSRNATNNDESDSPL